MITASHNPKNDNGYHFYNHFRYKLYWNNACQVISPHDKYIQQKIDINREPWIWNQDIQNTILIPSNVIDSYILL